MILCASAFGGIWIAISLAVTFRRLVHHKRYQWGPALGNRQRTYQQPYGPQLDFGSVALRDRGAHINRNQDCFAGVVGALPERRTGSTDSTHAAS